MDRQPLKKSHDIQIAGMPYRLRSMHDDQTVQELVEFVEKKIVMSLESTKSGSFQSAAVLAALNIAEELILLKRHTSQDLEELESKMLGLTRQLEKSRPTKSASA